MTDDELRLWKRYHDCQQHLASLPLFDSICYTCGELLFSKVRGHLFKRNKDNMDEIAPIAFKFAQLHDIPYESAEQRQWYCCCKCFHNMPLCPSYADPMTGNANMPSALQALPAAAAKRAVLLCSIYSSTFRKRILTNVNGATSVAALPSHTKWTIIITECLAISRLTLPLIMIWHPPNARSRILFIGCEQTTHFTVDSFRTTKRHTIGTLAPWKRSIMQTSQRRQMGNLLRPNCSTRKMV